MSRSLDEVLAPLAADRRRWVEARAAELIAKEAARHASLGGLLAGFDPEKHRRNPMLDEKLVGTEPHAQRF